VSYIVSEIILSHQDLIGGSIGFGGSTWPLRREEERENLMGRKVVSCPVAGTWLVSDSVLGLGKTKASGVAVYWYGGRGRGGWWQCEACGVFIHNTKEPCDHVIAVGAYAVREIGPE
jgi:hypothetical protein